MKVLITETQSDIIKLRRHYGAIQDEFTERTYRYNPCNFNYEGGIEEMFDDIVAFTVDAVLGKLFNVYDDDDDNSRFENLSMLLKHMLFETEFKSFERDIQEYHFEHCRDTEN
jgi:hypothetical protein